MQTTLEFYRKWANGCGHEMCASSRHVVLSRGTIPCPIVFIGEAPGISEDCIGFPFVGPAGKLMDSIIERAGVKVPHAFCNLVACIPIDHDTGHKAVEPSDNQVMKCAPRLIDFLDLCQPKVIVCVGQLADAWMDQKQRLGIKLPPSCATAILVSIPHPAGILRAPVAQQSLMIQRSIVVLAAVADKLPRSVMVD